MAAGIVRDVKVSDFQQVRKEDLLVALEDNDYLAHVAQASAAVEAAKAAIENNRRQSELQDARIARAHVVRTRKEHDKQEALLLTSSSTPQKVEQVDADEQCFAAQLASRVVDLEQAKTVLGSNELTVEAEMRSKAVWESQELQLIDDLHAKEAALTVAQMNLRYRKIATVRARARARDKMRDGWVSSIVCTYDFGTTNRSKT